MSNDAEVRALPGQAALAEANRILAHVDWQMENFMPRKGESGRDCERRRLADEIAAALLAAEARSHDGEWEEAMREAFNEALWAGWRSGLAGELMDDNHAAKAWAASDAAAKVSASPLFDEGRL